MTQRGQTSPKGSGDPPASLPVAEARTPRSSDETSAPDAQAERLAGLLPCIAVLAFLQSVHTSLLAPSKVIVALSALSLAVGVVCVLASSRLRRGAIRPGQALQAALGALPVILVISAYHLILHGDFHQVLAAALVVVGTAYLPLPPQRIATLQGATVAAWTCLASIVLPPLLFLCAVGALASVALLSSPSSRRWISDWHQRLKHGAAGADSSSSGASSSGALTQSAAENMAHDHVTGLPGRNAVIPKLQQAVQRARTAPAPYVAVMMLDVDEFKNVNDSLGYEIGDQVLAAAASRLRGRVRRRTDDFVARFGADEFVVLLHQLRQPEDALKIAHRLQGALAEVFQVANQEVRIGVSIGVAVGDGNTERPEDLLWDADIAMRHVKSSRKGSIEVFTAQMHSEVVRACQLRSDLWKALEREELLLHYQPIISLRSGQIAGAEALLRWRHSSGELIEPLRFIPIAEETGLIEPIGEWVLKTASTQAAEWQEAGLPPISMAVNLSAHQLHQPSLARIVARVLAEAHLPPEYVELELTETTLMENLEGSMTAMRQLVALGVRISIDDFGTGYSSFSYLRRLPCDKLKIDRSFVADLTADTKSAAIVGGMINLAHNLDLQVTAEGVEMEDQLSFLRASACDQVQGRLVSEPLEAHRFTELLRSDFNLHHEVRLARDERL